MYITFRTIGIGEDFSCNGVTYTKRSTRTAVMHSNGRIFYFGQMDSCIV